MGNQSRSLHERDRMGPLIFPFPSLFSLVLFCNLFIFKQSRNRGRREREICIYTERNTQIIKRLR